MPHDPNLRPLWLTLNVASLATVVLFPLVFKSARGVVAPHVLSLEEDLAVVTAPDGEFFNGIGHIRDQGSEISVLP